MCGSDGRPRLQGVQDELVTCCCGRGGARRGAWRSCQHRDRAASCSCSCTSVGMRMLMLASLEAGKAVPSRAEAGWVLGRHHVLACLGLDWPWFGPGGVGRASAVIVSLASVTRDTDTIVFYVCGMSGP